MTTAEWWDKMWECHELRPRDRRLVRRIRHEHRRPIEADDHGGDGRPAGQRHGTRVGPWGASRGTHDATKPVAFQHRSPNRDAPPHLAARTTQTARTRCKRRGGNPAPPKPRYDGRH